MPLKRQFFKLFHTLFELLYLILAKGSLPQFIECCNILDFSIFPHCDQLDNMVFTD